MPQTSANTASVGDGPDELRPLSTWSLAHSAGLWSLCLAQNPISSASSSVNLTAITLLKLPIFRKTPSAMLRIGFQGHMTHCMDRARVTLELHL